MDSLTSFFTSPFPLLRHSSSSSSSAAISRAKANNPRSYPSSIRCSCTNSSKNHDSTPNRTWVIGNIIRIASSQSNRWVSRFQSYNSAAAAGGNYLENGGLGLALLSVTSNARVKFSPFVATLAANPTFMSGLCAWFAAQSIKICLNFFVERKWDFRILFASGGMPSSHSALCTALTTSVALCHGVADSLFPVCLGFSLIVMYDAIGVRRHAGMQAEVILVLCCYILSLNQLHVLNKIVEDLFQGHPISERKLKELLGHTPSQVFAGALLGILVACICCQGCIPVT
ncbi:Uncharacterized membrane protein YuiD [Linum perenne]